MFNFVNHIHGLKYRVFGTPNMNKDTRLYHIVSSPFILPFITHIIKPFLNTFALLIRNDSVFSLLFNAHLQFKL